jgi:DNA-binding XRE family transcriptional regulator
MARKASKSDPAADLAQAVKCWREAAALPASRAAQLLGIPQRTLEGVEQGRGFRYPQLLILALEAFK